MKYEDFGYIRVRTYAADGALPIEGTIIKIYGADDYDKGVMHSLLTDSNGITVQVALPTPAKSYSVAPGAAEAPYSVYNVELAKDGYYPKKIDNVPIFAGTSALLPIEMVPLKYESDGSIIPQYNLNSVIYENDNL